MRARLRMKPGSERGTSVTEVILLTWLVLEGSHGPASVGLCIAAGLLPLGLGAAVASRRAERDDRRLLLVGAQALLALVALG